jgi:preprotein translocase subunit SecE
MAKEDASSLEPTAQEIAAAVNSSPKAGDSTEDAPKEKAASNTDVQKKSTAPRSNNIFVRLVAFIRSIFDELSKVTAPTRDELIEYVIVVLVFVLVIMLFITGIDFAIGKGVMALFAK